MSKTAKGLVEYARAQLGRPYWWGTFGQTACASLLAAKRKQYPGYYQAAAIIALVGYYNKAFKWYQKQERQEMAIARMKEENTMVVFALSACLDGLQQLGCNHTVTTAKDKLDKYINQKAHE